MMSDLTFEMFDVAMPHLVPVGDTAAAAAAQLIASVAAASSPGEVVLVLSSNLTGPVSITTYTAAIEVFESVLIRIESPVGRAKRAREVFKVLARQFDCNHPEEELHAYGAALVGLMQQMHARYGTTDPSAIEEEEVVEARAILNAAVRAEAVACLGCRFVAFMPVVVAVADYEVGGVTGSSGSGVDGSGGGGKMFLQDVVALILSTKVQLVELLQVGVAQAAKVWCSFFPPSLLPP
jgi:hypothetical protein